MTTIESTGLKGARGSGGQGQSASSAIDRTNPEFEDERVDGEAEPHRYSEELFRTQVGQGTGGEKDSHYRARRGDAEKDGDRAQEPSAFEGGLAALTVGEGAGQGVEKQSVEEINGGSFGPAADGVTGHGVCGQADDGSQGKENPLGPLKAREPREDSERREEHEEYGRNDMRQREHRMRFED